MDHPRQDTQRNVGKAVYIELDEIETYPMEGCAKTLKRDFLRSEYVDIDQTIIKGRGAAEDYGISQTDRMQYVLDGEASLWLEGTETEILPGHLLVVPRGILWGEDFL